MTQQECTMTEAELVEGLKLGSDAAFRCLYVQCFQACKKFFLTNGGNETDARDLFQEAIMVLLDEERVKIFLANKKAKVSTYLISIFRYKCSNYWRSKKRFLEGDYIDTLKDYNIADESDGFDEEPNNFVKIYQDCMKTLGEICQKLILLTYIDLKRDEEIAKIFGWTLPYVRLRRFRCMQTLRACANN